MYLYLNKPNPGDWKMDALGELLIPGIHTVWGWIICIIILAILEPELSKYSLDLPPLRNRTHWSQYNNPNHYLPYWFTARGFASYMGWDWAYPSITYYSCNTWKPGIGTQEKEA
jgi:hypothetical protein